VRSRPEIGTRNPAKQGYVRSTLAVSSGGSDEMNHLDHRRLFSKIRSSKQFGPIDRFDMAALFFYWDA
jgi:hypothetical protein